MESMESLEGLKGLIGLDSHGVTQKGWKIMEGMDKL
jgi:hypothetical protein